MDANAAQPSGLCGPMLGSVCPIGGQGVSGTWTNVGNGGQFTVTAAAPAGTLPGSAPAVALGTTLGMESFAAPPAPTLPLVASVSPNSGYYPDGPRGPITITGSGFSNATSVRIGSANLTPRVGYFNVISDSEIQVGSPFAPLWGLQAGTLLDVTVTTPIGTSVVSASSKFTYTPLPPPPRITSISPESGVIAGGTWVTLTGTHLAGASVSMAGQSAAVESSSDNQIVVITPHFPFTGSFIVQVTTLGGSDGRVFQVVDNISTGTIMTGMFWDGCAAGVQGCSLSADIDWGDGSVTAGSVVWVEHDPWPNLLTNTSDLFAVQGSHTYTYAGLYTINTTVHGGQSEVFNATLRYVLSVRDCMPSVPNLVDFVYQGLLNRGPTPSEMISWLEVPCTDPRLSSADALTAQVRQWLQSPDGLSERQRIATTTIELMSQHPLESSQGSFRDAIVAYIATSGASFYDTLREVDGRMVDAAYERLLGGGSDGFGRDFWIDQLIGGVTPEGLWAAIGQSQTREDRFGYFAPVDMRSAQVWYMYPPNQCFGAIGSNCSGLNLPLNTDGEDNPVWINQFTRPDGLEMGYVRIAVAVGSIAHDNYCLRDLSGHWCHGSELNDVQAPIAENAGMEWDKAVDDVYNGYRWIVVYGPYPTGKDAAAIQHWSDDLRPTIDARPFVLNRSDPLQIAISVLSQPQDSRIRAVIPQLAPPLDTGTPAVVCPGTAIDPVTGGFMVDPATRTLLTTIFCDGSTGLHLPSTDLYNYQSVGLTETRSSRALRAPSGTVLDVTDAVYCSSGAFQPDSITYGGGWHFAHHGICS